MEILDNLPEELKWNVLKFSVHPCAELIRKCLDRWDYDVCYCCDKTINMNKAENAFLYHDVITICGNCYDTNAKDIVSNYKNDYGEDARIYFRGFGDSDSDRHSHKCIDSDTDSD